MNNIKVTIPEYKKIPTIGKGPINNPIYITQDQYNLLKLLGIKVVVVEENTKIPTPIIPDSVKEELQKEDELKNGTLDEEIIDTDNEVKDIIEESEEVFEEEVIEEVEEESEEDSEEEYEEVDINTLTKKELKEKLDEMEISYPNNANVSTLREILEKNL